METNIVPLGGMLSANLRVLLRWHVINHMAFPLQAVLIYLGIPIGNHRGSDIWLYSYGLSPFLSQHTWLPITKWLDAGFLFIPPPRNVTIIRLPYSHIIYKYGIYWFFRVFHFSVFMWRLSFPAPDNVVDLCYLIFCHKIECVAWTCEACMSGIRDFNQFCCYELRVYVYVVPTLLIVFCVCTYCSLGACLCLPKALL